MQLQPPTLISFAHPTTSFHTPMATSNVSHHIHHLYPYINSSPISPVSSHFQPPVSTIPYFPLPVLPTQISFAQTSPSLMASSSQYSSHQHHIHQENIVCVSPVALGDSCWFLDFGVTYHLTSDPTNPQVTTLYFGLGKLPVGNGSSLHISATRSSLIPTHHINLQLNNILYTPRVTKSLLSLS